MLNLYCLHRVNYFRVNHRIKQKQWRRCEAVDVLEVVANRRLKLTSTVWPQALAAKRAQAAQQTQITELLGNCLGCRL